MFKVATIILSIFFTAYRNLTQGDSNYPISSFVANDVKTDSLEIDILTLGGNQLDKVFDKVGGQRLQVTQTLFVLLPPPIMSKESIEQYTVLISQEEASKPRNNPTDAIIDDKELLQNMRNHLASRGTIVCRLTNVVLPSKFELDATFLFIDVDRWPFPNVSVIDKTARNVVGFINTSTIKNFATIRADNALHAVAFGKGDSKPGIAVPVNITDVFDIKRFAINVRNCDTQKNC